jgi:hypothetical protein
MSGAASAAPHPHFCKEVVYFQRDTGWKSLQVWHSKEVICRYANPRMLRGFFSGL